MSEAKEQVGHTPGPWSICRYTNYNGFSIHAPQYGCISERWYDQDQAPPYGDQIGANARLIAAAPDLLEQLEAALEFITEYEDVNDGEDGEPEANKAMSLCGEIRAALFKATGETL